MKKIKPCPFCGEIPNLILCTDGYYRLKCNNEDCYTRLKASLMPANVITAWNTRLKAKKITI